MLFIFANIALLAFAAFVSWWLSGYDTRVTGKNETEDRIRRGIRCGITLLLVETAFWGLWRYWRYNDRASGMAYLMFALPLSIIWCGCISELFARGFHWLIDPEDNREFDPKKGLREMDVIANLIRSGRKDEAIRLCQMLKQTGDVSRPVLEMTLEYLGVPQENFRKPRPLIEADRLRSQGRLQEAELILNSLLAENPRNLEAAMMLMRLYAQDLRRPDKAGEVLRVLEQQPHISAAYFEFARRSIGEWSQRKPQSEEVTALPESIDELLAQGYFGTAIEMLEQKIKEQPQDFDLRLTLAGVYTRHCGDVHQAKKIVQQIEANPAFSPEQKQLAKAKLEEWRESQLRRK